MLAMALDDPATSNEEHPETRGLEAHPGCRNAVHQNVLGILDRSYVHRLPRSGVHQIAPANTEGTAMQNRRR